MADPVENRWLALLTGRRFVWVLAGLFTAAGLVCIATDYTLHDEGLFTYMMADWLRRDFVPVLFLQHSRPTLSLLYLPAAAMGLRAMLVMHLVVAAAAIPMLASVARSLGIKFPNFAALVLACSPAFAMTAPAGISSSDIVAGLTLALYLLVVRRANLASGLVLGLLPWVRTESALIVGVIVLVELATLRNLRLLFGSLLFPVLYGVSGALFHRDLLWPIHFPAALMQPMPGNPVWQHLNSQRFIGALFVLTPAFGALPLVRRRGWSALEAGIYLAAFAWLVLATVLPIWRIANFGFIPRYYLQTLPMVALLAGRAFDTLMDQGEFTLRGITPFGLVILMAVAAINHQGAIFIVVALLIAVATVVMVRRARLAASVLVLLVVAGPFLGLPTEVPSRDRWTDFPVIGEWLSAHPSDQPVLTNSPLIAAYFKGAGGRPGLNLRFLVGVDHLFELKAMSDPLNGQQTAVVHLMEQEFDGAPGVLPEHVRPDEIADGTLFVFRDDDRLQLLMPEKTWASHLTNVFAAGRYRIAKFAK